MSSMAIRVAMRLWWASRRTSSVTSIIFVIADSVFYRRYLHAVFQVVVAVTLQVRKRADLTPDYRDVAPKRLWGYLECGVIPQPLRVSCLADHAIGQGKHRGNDLGLLRLYPVAVHPEKHGPSQKRSAFVAVYKAVILAQAGGVGGRQIKQIWISVGEQVLRPVQGGFDGPPVADPR